MTNLVALVPILLVEGGFLLVVGLLSRGRVRLLGLVAGALWLMGTLLNTLALPYLYTELDVSLPLVSGLFGITHWAALVLVAVALVIGGRAEAARGTAGTGAGPATGRPEPQPWGQAQPEPWNQGQPHPDQQGGWQRHPDQQGGWQQHPDQQGGWQQHPDQQGDWQPHQPPAGRQGQQPPADGQPPADWQRQQQQPPYQS